MSTPPYLQHQGQYTTGTVPAEGTWAHRLQSTTTLTALFQGAWSRLLAAGLTGDNALGAGASVGFVLLSVWFTQGKLLDGIASSRAEKDVPTILEIMQRHRGLVEIQE